MMWSTSRSLVEPQTAQAGWLARWIFLVLIQADLSIAWFLGLTLAHALRLCLSHLLPWVVMVPHPGWVQRDPGATGMVLAAQPDTNEDEDEQDHDDPDGIHG
jgi:hypothetical protein